jgi:hypothetical protein
MRVPSGSYGATPKVAARIVRRIRLPSDDDAGRGTSPEEEPANQALSRCSASRTAVASVVDQNGGSDAIR